MWPRNLLRKFTCFSTLVQINERRLDSSIIQTRSADRSGSVTRVNEHASDIKTASGLADALSSKTAVRPSKPLLLSGDKCLFTLRIEPLSMQSKSIQVDGEKRRRFETIRRAGWKNNEADYRNARLKSEGRSHRHLEKWTFAVAYLFFGEIERNRPSKISSIETVAIVRRAPMDSPRAPPPTFPLPSTSPRAPPGQPTSVAFPPSSKYVGGSECTRLDVQQPAAANSSSPPGFSIPCSIPRNGTVPGFRQREREANSRLDDRREIEDKRKRQQHSRPTYAPLRQVRSNRAIRRFFFFFLLVPRRRDRREECTTRSILGGIWWTDSS